MSEIGLIVDKVVERPAIKGVVISFGKGVIGGADLAIMQAARRRRRGQAKRRRRGGGDARLLQRDKGLKFSSARVEKCGKPVAAAIDGTVLGGGFELPCCHYRIVSDEPKIQLGQPEMKVGLLPGGGGTQRIPRLMRGPTALPILLQGIG